jgi:Zn-dependent protease
MGSARIQPRASGTLGGLVLAGVPVRFHFTFFLLILFVVAASATGSREVWVEAAFIGALFASVLLHELGHAITARSYGIRTLEIVMYPIGGVARLAEQPRPRAELWIALAGPAVNVVIAGAVYGALILALPAEKTLDDLLRRIAVGNLYLAAFNMVPAFPMDGGRVLRALLAMWKGEEAAIQIAAGTGRTLAVAMGLYGLATGQVFLLFIAFLVYMAATQERLASTGRTLTQGMPVRAAMITDFRTLPHGSTMREAADLLLSTSQQDFPVMHGDQVIGLLDRTAFVRGVAMEGGEAFVSAAMNRDFVRLDPEMDLAQALPALADAGHCALVMEGDTLVGLLTPENISEFLLLRKLGMRPGQRVKE